MFCVAALSVVAACGAAVDPTISASTDEPQRARESPRAAPDLPDGSLAALTAEVRQLRVAVEELARSQTETQALGVYLSAQQGRLQQADQQLAAARRELDSATAAGQRIEAQLASLSAEQRTVSPEKRAETTIRSRPCSSSRRASTAFCSKPEAAKASCLRWCGPKKPAGTS
jgi:chromosome segregation ATPase